jgi:hypothetical protein
MLKVVIADDKAMLSFLLNGGIATVGAILMGIQSYNHDGHVHMYDHMHNITGMGYEPQFAGVVGASAVCSLGALAIYSLLVALQIFCTSDEVEESPTGERLRNILTTVSVLAVFAPLGYEVVGLGGIDTSMLTIIPALLVAILKVFDPLLDKLEATGERGLSSSMTVRCKPDADLQPVVSYFSPRAILINVFIAGSGFALVLHDSSIQDSEYHRKVGQSTSNIYWILYILMGSHFVMYPLFWALSMSESVGTWLKDNLTSNGCGADEVLSPNRIPLVRQALAGTVLALLSYLFGALYEFHRVELLVGSLVLYTLADMCGRNYL